MTEATNPRRTFLPDDDPMPELNKHLTPQQWYEVAQACEFVKSQTGHGQVVIEYKNGLPRFVKVEISKELKTGTT